MSERRVCSSQFTGSTEASGPAGSCSLGPVEGGSFFLIPCLLVVQGDILSFLFVKDPSLAGTGVLEKMSPGDGI